MQNKDSTLKNNLLLKIDISTKNPFVRLIGTIITITVVLLYINAHMDAAISKRQISELNEKFENKDIYLMKEIASSCINEGVNPINREEMMSCLINHKEAAIKPLESTLSGSRIKRFFIFLFSCAIFTLYFLLLRYKHTLVQAQDGNNDQ